MEKFIARQPIFDRHEKVYAYELLFRMGMEPFFRSDDPDRASQSVIADSFLSIGMDALTAGKKAFINCTREIIVREYPTLLPRDQAVVEILESVEPDEAVMAACKKIKQWGYMLALDDFVDSEKMNPLVDLADIVKVDFTVTEPAQRKELVRRFSPRGIRMLAEKVETREAFHEAVSLGYSLFQGYFFCKPETISRKDIPVFKRNYIEVLQAVNSTEPDLEEIEAIIKREVSLCYKLLRYLNSAYFGFRGEIRSIKHALTLLGLNEVRKWTSLVALAALGDDKAEELIVNSITRSRFCEGMAPLMSMTDRRMELFLVGLFSVTDAILDRPMSAIVEEIPLSPDVKEALLTGQNQFGEVLELFRMYDGADWDGFGEIAKKLGIDESAVPYIYLESVDWARKIFSLR